MSGGALLILCVGAALLAYGLTQSVRSTRPKSWRSALGLVDHASVGSVRTGAAASLYFPDIHFSYDVDGHRYRSKQYAIAFQDYAYFEKDRAAQIVARYGVGTTTPILYCPSDPRRAVIEPNTSPRTRSHWAACACAGVLVSAIALVVHLMAAA